MKPLLHFLVFLGIVGMIGMVSVSLVPPPSYAQQQQGEELDPCPNPFDPSTGQWIGFSTEDAANLWGTGLGPVEQVFLQDENGKKIEIKKKDNTSFIPKKYIKTKVQRPRGPVKRCDPAKTADPGPIGQTPTGTNVTP